MCKNIQKGLEIPSDKYHILDRKLTLFISHMSIPRHAFIKACQGIEVLTCDYITLP